LQVQFCQTMKIIVLISLFTISICANGQRVIKDGDTYLKAGFLGEKFDSLANFEDATFGSLANFFGAEFNSEANFYGTTFNSEARFHNTEFNSVANFRDSEFDSIVGFFDAEFDSMADIRSAVFNSSASFGGAVFNSEANFGLTEFNSEARFDMTEFNSVADFSYTKFNSVVVFNITEFNSVADFSYTKFNSVADFESAKFKEEVIFNFSTLPDTLYFTGVKSEKIIDFTSCQERIDTLKPISSENVCVIFLARTDLSKIRLNYTDFKLAFDEYSITKKGIANTYERLLGTQREFPEGYKKLDIEYKEFKYLQKGLKGKIYNFFDKYWWNYSYDKEKVIYNTLILLLIFSIMNWFLFEYLNQNVYKIEKVWNNYLESKEGLKKNGISSRTRKMINILPYSFYYTSLIFFGFKMNTDNINYRNHIGLFYLVFLYLVGIVDLLFIANFVFTG